MELRAIVYSVFSVLLSIANVESRGPQQVTYVKCKKFIYHMTILFHFIWNTTFLTQVTCGSVLKLQNVHHKIRLHSHDVKYGSGSGQQSVTGTEVKEDVNSHWAIKGNHNDVQFFIMNIIILFKIFAKIVKFTSLYL